MPEIRMLNGRPVTPIASTQHIPELTSNTVCLFWDYDSDADFTEIWNHFVEHADLGKVKQLIIGRWDEEVFDMSPDGIIESLILRDAPRLAHIESLFFGDISGEESEISWIINGELGPLLEAFPNLTYFGTRGGNDLRFKKCSGHPKLQTLVIESGGLQKETVQDIIAMDLPELRELELWLGDSNYGFTGDIDTYLPLIVGKPYPDNSYPFPKLETLRLKNSEIADDLAKAFLDAPVLSQLKTLDLSMGTMSNLGAQALADNAELDALKTLDLSNNYIDDDSILDRLRSRGLSVDGSGQKDDEEYGRYVDVGE